MSQNNNIFLPLMHWIIENDLENEIELIKILHYSIEIFNKFISHHYVEYKQYLIDHTDYQAVLQGMSFLILTLKIIADYLRIYGKSIVTNTTQNSARANIQRFEPSLFNFDMLCSMFLEKPSLLFFINLYKLMRDKEFQSVKSNRSSLILISNIQNDSTKSVVKSRDFEDWISE